MKVFVKADPSVSLKAFHRRIRGMYTISTLLPGRRADPLSPRSREGGARRLSQRSPLPTSHRDGTSRLLDSAMDR